MKNLRVLFLGNSHTFYNDMPQIFKELCEAGGDHAEVTMQAHGGVTYNWHFSQKWELRFAMLHGNYDYLVMQQAAHSPCPSKEETVRDGSALIDMARGAGVTPLVTIPWAERRDPPHQAEMYDIYGTLAQEKKVLCSPVGQVFERVFNEHPDIDLYWVDGEHCSPYGSYVNACVHYAQIVGKSPVGLPAMSYTCVTGTKEDMDQVQAMLAAAGANPENPQLKADAMAEYRRCFRAIMDQDAIRVELDADKTRLLQELCWEEVQKYNATRA